MIRLNCTFFSEALGREAEVTVLLPASAAGRPYPVLYLLHGLTDSGESWDYWDKQLPHLLDWLEERTDVK